MEDRAAGGSESRTQERRTDVVGELRSKANPILDDDWLRHLHSSYVDRYLSDNQRIWATAAILVPVSLAAFPAFFALGERHALVAAVFGTFSVLVMAFWYAIAERHRHFQRQAFRVVKVLEDVVLSVTLAEDLRRAARENLSSPRPTVRTARQGLLVGVAVAWAGIVLLAWTGTLPDVSK